MITNYGGMISVRKRGCSTFNCDLISNDFTREELHVAVKMAVEHTLSREKRAKLLNEFQQVSKRNSEVLNSKLEIFIKNVSLENIEDMSESLLLDIFAILDAEQFNLKKLIGLESYCAEELSIINTEMDSYLSSVRFFIKLRKIGNIFGVQIDNTLTTYQDRLNKLISILSDAIMK